MTNNEKINAMSVDEKVEFLKEHQHYRCLHCFYHYQEDDCWDKDCEQGYKKWLESEV